MRSSEFEENEVVTLTASPAAGYRFQSWQKCSGGLNGRQCTVTMSEAKEVGVKFKQTYALTIGKTGTGLGVVDNTSNGVTCTNRCTTSTIPFPEAGDDHALHRRSQQRILFQGIHRWDRLGNGL